MNVNEKPYNVKSNNRVVYTTLDALKAHNFALDLAERTDEAVTVDPDPMHDLATFARDFPVNFKLACGYPGAKLPSYPLPFVDSSELEFAEWDRMTDADFMEWESKTLQAG